ncbi:hypothetical protein K450DRAFT_253970 [Umbelopsis ramanniana AG]|uniref:Uncharacterized protein n=1 Tax=Umbelopsis ramanniana AG TaxID=1314678 RepID=A0AAD5E4I5_UMBRA|nr:uncharacterized protein K450DRAFT_253970 [Umbelopsis ramanniana AG]KAI8577013.1 hypothetical protein K450DRAFT_253970 [Umbelopsis ramanniana AG]
MPGVGLSLVLAYLESAFIGKRTSWMERSRLETVASRMRVRKREVSKAKKGDTTEKDSNQFLSPIPACSNGRS